MGVAKITVALSITLDHLSVKGCAFHRVTFLSKRWPKLARPARSSIWFSAANTMVSGNTFYKIMKSELGVLYRGVLNYSQTYCLYCRNILVLLGLPFLTKSFHNCKLDLENKICYQRFGVMYTRGNNIKRPALRPGDQRTKFSNNHLHFHTQS